MIRVFFTVVLLFLLADTFLIFGAGCDFSTLALFPIESLCVTLTGISLVGVVVFLVVDVVVFLEVDGVCWV